jgi:hypothetical protein
LRVPEWRIWLKSLKAFELLVLTLTVPGLCVGNLKIGNYSANIFAITATIKKSDE